MPDLNRVNPGVLYTIGRLGCFLGVAAVLYVVGFRSWLLVLAALVISAPLSFVLLRGVRNAWGAQLERGLSNRKAEKKRLRATLRGDDATSPPA